jgi:hypothetical protein
MRKAISIILMMMSISAFAETTSCVDKKTSGQIFKVNIAWPDEHMKEPLITVNGVNLTIVAEVVKVNGLITSEFVDKLGIEAGYTIAMNNNKLYIAKSFRNKEIKKNIVMGDVTELSCSKSFIKPFLKYKYS